MSISRWRRQFRKYRSQLGAAGNDRDLCLAAFLSAKRQEFLSSPYYASSPRARALGRRLASAHRSAILRVLSAGGPKRKVIKSPRLLLYKVRPDPLRDKLSPKFMTRWKNISERLKDRKRSHIILSELSFSRNPEGTLAQLRDVVRAASTSMDIQIDFLDSRCDDVAPYIVLSHLMRALPPVFSGGSIALEVAAVIEAVGLDKYLGITKIFTSRHRDYPILPFKMARRVPPGYFGDQDHQLRPQYKEYIADRFCNALESWLATHDQELTPEAAGSLINSITEALDNAERHGRPEVDGGMGDWSMAGFSRLIEGDDGDTRLECSVSIVSAGATIAESLETAAPNVRDRIERYVQTHAPKGTERRASMRTVMALQDGVTRVSEASEASRGGVGLMTLVNLFAELGDTDNDALQSVFTILSGSSCLRVTSPYRRGVRGENSTLRELWFNDENCATRAPSASYVFEIEDEFAGTILSACFTIDPEFLNRKLSE